MRERVAAIERCSARSAELRFVSQPLLPAARAARSSRPARPSRWRCRWRPSRRPPPKPSYRPLLQVRRKTSAPKEAAALCAQQQRAPAPRSTGSNGRRWGPAPCALKRRCRSLPQPRARTRVAQPATAAPKLTSLAPGYCHSQACRRSADAVRLCGCGQGAAARWQRSESQARWPWPGS